MLCKNVGHKQHSVTKWSPNKVVWKTKFCWLNEVYFFPFFFFFCDSGHWKPRAFSASIRLWQISVDKKALQSKWWWNGLPYSKLFPSRTRWICRLGTLTTSRPWLSCLFPSSCRLHWLLRSRQPLLHRPLLLLLLSCLLLTFSCLFPSGGTFINQTRK